MNNHNKCKWTDKNLLYKKINKIKFKNSKKQCKWTEHPNQKADIIKMDKKTRPTTYFLQ